MLHLPLKQTDKVDLQKPLYKFVEVAYSSEQADEHRDAFAEVSSLREQVRQLALDEESASDAVRTLLRYYRVLVGMRTRFGAVVEDAETWGAFTWKDALKPSEKASRPELNFEIGAVLYNLAAALSFSATTQDRTTPTGLRAACQAFQFAAGAFDALSALGLAAGSAACTPDMHGRAIAGWRAIMLAQAQQCFYEKACTDAVRPSIVAKLVSQAAVWLEEAAEALRHKELKGVGDKWARTADGQAITFHAWAQFHAAAEHEGAYEYGHQVCRLSRASTELSQLVGSASRAGPAAVLQAQADALERISSAAAKASHLNESVYSERVPPYDALSPPVRLAASEPAPLPSPQPPTARMTAPAG